MGRDNDMIVIESQFINYLNSLKKELYDDPTNFIPHYRHNYDKNYYLTHREHILECQRRYNQQPEIRKLNAERTKLWQSKHRDIIREKAKRYHEAHKDEVNAKARERYRLRRAMGLKK